MAEEFRTHTITIRLTKQERALLQRAAEDTDRVPSELLRHLLRVHLRQKGYLRIPKKKAR